MFFELDAAGDLLRFYREFIVDAPEELGCFPAYQIAPPLPFIPEDRHGEPFIAMVTCWAGDLDAGEKALQPIRDVAPRVGREGRRRCRTRRSTVPSTRWSRPGSSTTGRRTSSPS